LLSLIRFAFSIVAFTLLVLFILLLDLLATLAFSSSKGGSNGGGKDFGGFFSRVVETGCGSVLEWNIGIVLSVSTAKVSDLIQYSRPFPSSLLLAEG
jgi:hypothetical protein